MVVDTLKNLRRRLFIGGNVLTLALVAASCSVAIQAQDSDHGRHDRDFYFYPGNLVLSRSVFTNDANIVVGTTVLPPGCTSGCSVAAYDGNYPEVFNNDLVDGSFGVTSRLLLDQLTPDGWKINTLELPNSLQPWVTEGSNQLVTSFSSKSEGAINLSTSKKYISFIDYVAAVDTVDVSNGNTPGVIDSTNPVPGAYYRAAAVVDARGHISFTETNAYSGNNGRAAILNDKDGANVIYTAGNAGNGSNPQPEGVVLGAGAQIFDWLKKTPEADQDPGLPTPVGSFNVTLLGDKKDKIGKDDNFRGLTLFNNVLYYSKGSGGNGVNTVYFLDTTGTACKNGAGLPSATATLPTSGIMYNSSTVVADGLPSNMCILNGFSTTLAKASSGVYYPFGLWFADANTLYVADEGDGYAGGTDLYTHAAGSTGGLQKWVFNSTTGSWSLAYTLTAGLKIGTPYTVEGYPTGTNAATGLPWAPTTDGLRNITGRVNRDGTVTIWAITSTVSGGGDTGADPNKLVAITDRLRNTTATGAAKESFVTLRSAGFAEVLRGISFTPGTDEEHGGHGGWGQGW